MMRIWEIIIGLGEVSKRCERMSRKRGQSIESMMVGSASQKTGDAPTVLDECKKRGENAAERGGVGRGLQNSKEHVKLMWLAQLGDHRRTVCGSDSRGERTLVLQDVGDDAHHGLQHCSVVQVLRRDEHHHLCGDQLLGRRDSYGGGGGEGALAATASYQRSSAVKAS